MKHKMIEAFKKAEGGLFSAVEKADVGNSYQEMEKQGIALMGWADPFMPDYSLPEHVKKAMLAEIEAPSASHYTAPIGSYELKVVLAKKLKEKNFLRSSNHFQLNLYTTDNTFHAFQSKHHDYHVQ